MTSTTFLLAWRRLAALACFTTLIAACGGGSGEAAPAGEGGATPAPAPTTAEVPVRGTVQGLNGTLVLMDATGRPVTLTANGSFSFTALTPAGTGARLVVSQQPVGQDCSVAVTSAAGAATLDVQVSCQARTYPITVQVPVVPATLVLTSSLGERLTVTVPGTYTFVQPVTHGQGYGVTVQVAAGTGGSTTATCTATAASGTADGQPIAVQFACSTAPVTAPPPVPVAPVEPPPPPPVPTTPAGLTVSYGIKTYAFAWSPTALATHYRLFEDPDGAGALPAVQVGSNLTTTTHTVTHAVLLDQRLNAQYTVQACNADGCGAPTAALVPDLTRAIGFFKAGNPQFAANFGYSVALSNDGSTLAVGARQEGTGILSRSGAVYVFALVAGQWQQQAYLKASNAGADDNFGTAVALSASGNTLVIGAPGESSDSNLINSGSGDDSVTQAGAAYVFQRTGTVWSQEAYLKANNSGLLHRFGETVGISGTGNRVAIGAPGEDTDFSGAFPTLFRTGAVYMYDRASNTTAWTAGSKLKDTGYTNRADFGRSLALSADGDTLAVGMPTESGNAVGLTAPGSINTGQRGDSGAVTIFRRQSNNLWGWTRTLKASNPDVGDQFGTSVAISADGTTVAVGAIGEDSMAAGVNGAQADNSGFNVGAVYVFSFGADWAQQAYIKPPAAPANQLRFGHALALSADGSLLAVGTPADESPSVGIGGSPAGNTASGSGSVTLFARTGTAWTQRSFIKGSYVAPAQRLGHAVAVSADGKTLAAGASQESSTTPGVQGTPAGNLTSAGAVYLY